MRVEADLLEFLERLAQGAKAPAPFLQTVFRQAAALRAKYRPGGRPIFGETSPNKSRAPATRGEVLAARDRYESDVIEIDDNAETVLDSVRAGGEPRTGGRWVSAWAWLPDGAASPDPEPAPGAAPEALQIALFAERSCVFRVELALCWPDETWTTETIDLDEIEEDPTEGRLIEAAAEQWHTEHPNSGVVAIGLYGWEKIALCEHCGREAGNGHRWGCPYRDESEESETEDDTPG